MVVTKRVLSSTSDRAYTVVITAGCECDGYRYTGHCKHILKVLKESK